MRASPSPARSGPSPSTTVQDGDVSFETDIRPLFRAEDADAMSWAFDLASYESVKEHAEDIYDRVADGSMPCDDPWPDEQVQRFRAWIERIPKVRLYVALTAMTWLALTALIGIGPREKRIVTDSSKGMDRLSGVGRYVS